MAMIGMPTKERVENMPLASEEYVVKAMPSIMGPLDMTTTYLVAIFFIVNAATAASGGAAAFTYLLLGGIAFFIPCVIATAQLGYMFPHEGSLYNWTHKTLGGYWSFFIGFCAWFPGVLVMVAGADIVMSFFQGLNNTWFVEPWQQGLVIIGVILFTGVLSLQRQRTVQNIVNVVVGLIFLAVLIIGIAAIVWLAKGHHSATNFADLHGWNIQWNPTTGNINLFGLITLAYLGTEVPLNMGGEIVGAGTDETKGRGIVKRHLLWGTVLVFVGYGIATLALLITQGSSVGSVGGFSLVTTVDMALGKGMGDVVAVCIICFFVMVPVVYNCTFSRLLLVASIDQRLPMNVGKLNKNRIPANAIIFQTIVAVIFTALVFIVAPYVINLGKPTDLATEVYNISQASATLVWAISTAFFFINLAVLYYRDKAKFHSLRIFPMPVLVISSIVGPIACLLAIVDTLFIAWIPQIPNIYWFYIIGGVTAVCIIIAAIGSILATSEASWQSTENSYKM